MFDRGEKQETTEDHSAANPDRESLQEAEGIKKKGIFDKISEMFKKSETQS